jgi:hypothetical protein
MEIIDGQSTRLAETSEVPGWKGDSPFFLVIAPDDRTREGGNIGIDLDEGGWIARHAEVMRIPSTWWLHLKQTGMPLFCLVVEEGDQPYFTKNHVGNLMAGSEIVSIGIGKKGKDGTMTRLWILPNGVVCGGDDVDIISSRMLGG